MVKEYLPNAVEEEFKVGLIINGEYEWIQAFKAIRNHLKIEPSESISFFCGKHIISGGKVINFYEKYKHSDEILYIQYVKLEGYG